MHTYHSRAIPAVKTLHCNLGSGTVTRSCWEEARFNNTYFVHPEYPANGRAVRSCVLTVHKVSPDVTQIRLDLQQFQVGAPWCTPEQLCAVWSHGSLSMSISLASVGIRLFEYLHISVVFSLRTWNHRGLHVLTYLGFRPFAN